MTNGELGSLALALMLVIGMANLMGHWFLRMRQPKIVGEILAGILIGPMVLGHLNISVADLFGANGSRSAAVLACFYNLGLLLLMFVSGSAARRVLARENWGPTAWLLACGTALPFLLALGLAKSLPLHAVAGANGALANTISVHVGTTIAYLATGLILMPGVLRYLSRCRWNVVAQNSPIGWIMTVLFAYVGVAGVLDVTPAFAGFLAGFAIVGGMKASEQERFAEPLNMISKISFATFIP